MADTTRLLIADDDKIIRDAIRLSLMGEPYDVIEASTLDEVATRVASHEPDVMLLDVHFQGGANSIELINTLSRERPALPVIVISGAATAAEAAACVKNGAFDFLEKPVSSDRLKLAIARGVEHARLKACVAGFTAPSGSSDNGQPGFVSRSPAMAAIKEQIGLFAGRDVKVLVTGETGTGKEVVAQALWRASARRHKPFVVVNAAAIPESLCESELFGHKKGSFTGAVADQMGKIEMANGGTLFLDEIGDLSAAAQIKLLRFLETGEIQPVGAHKTRVVDVRLIAATSRDLEQEMAAKRFRADLYFRLNVARIEIPPLRRRRDDIPVLFTYFVEQFARKFGETPKTIDDETMTSLTRYDWPGNVRELRNVAERCVLSSQGPRLHVPASILGASASKAPSDGDLDPNAPFPTLKEFRAEVERRHIERALERADGSITKAAAMLGIDRSYLHQKLAQMDAGKTTTKIEGSRS